MKPTSAWMAIARLFSITCFAQFYLVSPSALAAAPPVPQQRGYRHTGFIRATQRGSHLEHKSVFLPAKPSCHVVGAQFRGEAHLHLTTVVESSHRRYSNERLVLSARKCNKDTTTFFVTV
jgi:hypothetical protein